MEEGVYAVEEIVKLFQSKVDETLTVFQYLPDDVKQEAWKYWQEVTNTLHNVVNKIKIPQKNSSTGNVTDINEQSNQIPSQHATFDKDIDNIVTETTQSLLSLTNSEPRGTTVTSNQISSISQPDGIVQNIHMNDISHLAAAHNDLNFDLLQEEPGLVDTNGKFLTPEGLQAVPVTQTGNLRTDGEQQPETDIYSGVKQTIIDQNNSTYSNQTLTNNTIATPTESTTQGSNKNINDEFQAEINLYDVENNPTEIHEENTDANRKYPRRNRTSTKINSVYAYINLKAEGTKEERVKTDGKKDDKVKKNNKENVKKKKNTEVADDGSITCDVCGLRLARAASIIAHRRQHTGDRPFKCQFCDKTFTTKANKIRHENTHNGIKPFKCTECSQGFAENKTLKAHMLRHSGEKPHSCPICGESFTQRSTLQHHIYRHTGHKGHLCDLCGKSFRQKSQLYTHQRRHQDKRPYNCDTCQRSFFTKGDLGRHMLKHTNLRPFICDMCPKTFTRLQYLNEHKNFHKGIRPFICKDCNKSFYESAALYRHSKSHRVAPDTTSTAEAQQQQQTIIVTQDGREFEIPVVTTNLSNVLDGESQFADVYQITYLDNPVTDLSTSTQLQSTTVVTGIEDPIPTHLSSTIVEEADFSAINLLANATTQLIQ
ncbi:zinc finger protein 37 [Patella vulgata]|uniref:zinc finger protein 37 n=1 Tax=Patella vulgata TaxID=6465 RepID=UPI0021801B66|nr:zinc finger protein 37 [Patella vulgata]